MKIVNAHTTSQVRYSDPEIKNPPKNMEDSGEKCDLIIWDLWKNGIYSIHYMWVVNIDTPLYL